MILLTQPYKILLCLSLLLTTGKVSHDSTSLELIVRPWYKYRADGQAGREVLLLTRGGALNLPAIAKVNCDGVIEEVRLEKADSNTILLPAGMSVLKPCRLTVTLSGMEQTIFVSPKKQWTVFIYPHAHVDIGYTATQETVRKLQERNIEVGIDLARKTKDYPAGARFVWNPEANWVVSSYLQHANVDQKKIFVDAVKKGWVQIDAAHSNINTGICSDEEQMRMFRDLHQIQSATGVPITTLVQMDNPGAGWGIVQAAAQNGVKAFISFPNYYDVRKTIEHKPFYWEAQDGKSRIFFLQAFPYGIGYTIKGSKYGLYRIQSFSDKYDRVSTPTPMKNFIDPFIFEETAKLEAANSPYDLFAMTWSMADNCLIDADLPEAVRIWNARYAYPKLIIAGAKEIVAAYEQNYGAKIPTYKGDFSEFWTNGLGSDAKRVALSRKGKEDLVQAETLWSMLNRQQPAPAAFYDAWENLLLAAEHTWGAMTPNTPLAKEIEGNKAANFEKGAQLSKELIDQTLSTIKQEGSDQLAVLNTLSWARGGLVVLPAAQSKAGDRVVDEQGKDVLSQRLSTGELVFEAGKIPALASKLYKITSGASPVKANMIKQRNVLANELIEVAIGEESGTVISLLDKTTGRQLVNPGSEFGINSYNYQTGVYNGRDSIYGTFYSSETSIRVKEHGPLIASLLVTSKAPGCNTLTREIKLVHGQRGISITNVMDKTATLTKEGIHFGFAFNVPDGITRLDIPWGVIQPEKDQLPVANRNWLACQRWVDVSNKEYGVTFTALESPLIEIGGITGNVLDGARLPHRWLKHLPASQTILSWPVNNHWGTNFPPQQSGLITTNYHLLLHDVYNVVNANQFGVEQHRPLIAVPVAKNPVEKPLLQIDNPAVMISTLKNSDDNKATILRLRSISNKEEQVKLGFNSVQPKQLYICMANEKPLDKVTSTITVPAYGTVSVRMVF